MESAIIVDVETTGLSVRGGGRVIEVGAVLIEQGEITAEMETLIDSGASISYGAFRVHGISPQMLHGQPKPEYVWYKFLEFIGNFPLVAHNAPFDSIFIRHELNLCGRPLSNNWHCTVRLSRRKLPYLPSPGSLPTSTRKALEAALSCANYTRTWVFLLAVSTGMKITFCPHWRVELRVPWGTWSSARNPLRDTFAWFASYPRQFGKMQLPIPIHGLPRRP